MSPFKHNATGDNDNIKETIMINLLNNDANGDNNANGDNGENNSNGDRGNIGADGDNDDIKETMMIRG